MLHGRTRVIVLVVAVLAAACQPAGDDGSADPPRAEDSQARRGGEAATSNDTDAAEDRDHGPDGADADDDASPDGATTSPEEDPPERASTGDATSRQLPAGTALVWTREALPEEVVAAVADHEQVAVSTVVEVATAGLIRTTDEDGGTVEVTDDGWVLPVEVLAVDAAGYAGVTGLEVAGELGDGHALLSATSAQLRGLGPGGQLTFADGSDVEVAAIAADRMVGAAEVMVAAEDAPDGAEPRYLLARPIDDEVDLAAALSEAVDGDPAVRVRSVGETPVLRHADAVTAPTRLKAEFGEFALRDAAGRDIEQEPAWIDEHVITAQVPLLGEVTCHRAAVEALRGAMEALERRGAADAVAPGDYAGCWAPRFQSADGPLSTHAWGVAIDLDPEGLAQGSNAEPPATLVAAMADHGFTNGSDWLLPDPMHFELVPDRDPS